jgi:hypothetical protein
MTEQTAATPGRARIALVAFGSLGDGLLYLMMAENLRHNGYNVSYYGDIAHQIRHWMPQLDIHPYPPHDGFDAALADYDLVIMSPPQFLRDRMDERTLDAMRKKWLLICQRAPASWRHNLTATLRAQLPPEIYAELHDLLDCGGPIRFRKFADASVVDITLAYLRERMHLKQLTRQVMLTPPAGLTHRRHRHRIVVSPDSAWPEKKDWPARSFLRLCHALRARGYDPKIVVAPANHGHWTKLPGNVFDPPFSPASTSWPPTSTNPAGHRQRLGQRPPCFLPRYSRGHHLSQAQPEIPLASGLGADPRGLPSTDAALAGRLHLEALCRRCRRPCRPGPADMNVKPRKFLLLDGIGCR